MSKQTINVGSAANDKKGDSLRAAFQKVNANFTELYTALGLNDTTLNLGAFEFNGSVMTTTDSSAITIDQATTISSNLTVGGDLLPETNLGGNLGSPTKQWKSLYVSTNTIYINNVPLSLDNSNNILVNNTPISSTIEYTNIPNAPTDLSDLTDNTNLLSGGSADTGDFTFESSNLYATGRLELTNGSTAEEDWNAGIQIPERNASDTMYIRNIGVEGNDIMLQTPHASWAFTADGGTIFPTTTVNLHNGGNQSGQTLKFAGGNQVFITGPTPEDGSNAERIIIQGQRGTSGGEGGDVYLWGGDSDTNGGDIKIYAGDADSGSSGSGGYVYIDGGQGFSQGGPVAITGGYSSTSGGPVSLNGGSGGLGGGNVTIQAGYGTAEGGNVSITGGGADSGTDAGVVTVSSNGATWTFGNDGTLNLPASTDGSAIIQSPLPIKIITNGPTWAFGTDGRLDFPDGTIYYGNTIQATSESSVSLLSNDENNKILVNDTNVSITTDDSGYVWAFGSDGTLDVPGNILFPTSGLGAPTVSARSAGTKLVIWPEVDVTGHADYAIGMADSVLWQTVPTPGQSFKWYGGDQLALTVSGNGRLTPAGEIWAKSGDGINGLSFSANGTDISTYIKVDGGENTVLGSNNNFYVKRAGSDRLAITDTKTTLSATSSLELKSNSSSAKTWTFETNGSITFPDTTVQTTAYTGGAIVNSGFNAHYPSIQIGNFLFNIDSGGNPTVGAVSGSLGCDYSVTETYYNGSAWVSNVLGANAATISSVFSGGIGAQAFTGSGHKVKGHFSDNSTGHWYEVTWLSSPTGTGYGTVIATKLV